MSHISKIIIRNFRGIDELSQDFGDEKFIVLIGRGDSGKSTILSAIYAALSPSWNMSFSDFDFHNQDLSRPIEIELNIKELPMELLKDTKYGLFVQNGLNESCKQEELFIILKLTVDESLEPHWVVRSRTDSDLEDKHISSNDRALLAVNFIADYTDNQFAYNRQSPLYSLTKSALGNDTTIERVKSDFIRNVTVDEGLFKPLNISLDNLTIKANELGLDIDKLYAQIDIKENSYTGNSIALFNSELPYRLHGKGNKRLMSIAIQSELTKKGGIVLVDELEQGLEPDRIITLSRFLEMTKTGQVFITTHSAHVILEVKWNNLFIINKGAITMKRPDNEIDACRRSNPQAFFAKKIICCEGKTEMGFIRAIDNLLIEKYHTTLSANGVVLVCTTGGNTMYTYAHKFKYLGYDTCVFADDDTTKELSKYQAEANAIGISLFLCDKGYCLERQIIEDLPWRGILDIVNNKIDFPNDIPFSGSVLKQITNASDERTQNEIRCMITKSSLSERWFKHIPGGEFLGSIFTKYYDDIANEKRIKSNVISLLQWCEIIK
ncbi:MAG: AAA family ATPase [Prevotella sp.]|nr:AAA family ATPase [Prevotella sp.]